MRGYELTNAFTLPDAPNVFSINDTRIFGNAYDDEDVGEEADLNNLETTMNVSLIPTTRINKDHPKDPDHLRRLTLDIQTRRMTKISDEHAMDPTGDRYVVPNGIGYLLVSAGRPIMVPAGRNNS
ncbi:hypothetical protein Tco_0924979 [Tanacetum coccineum]|uniref:Uncharacterized protein n=1 Tax=Tanacetum coccineum TaxID=301880 RepID=A0ABQ5D5J8_9ASTR